MASTPLEDWEQFLQSPLPHNLSLHNQIRTESRLRRELKILRRMVIGTIESMKSDSKNVVKSSGSSKNNVDSKAKVTNDFDFSRFCNLPTEIRLLIYDRMFEPKIVTRPKRVIPYIPEDMQGIRLRTLRAGDVSGRQIIIPGNFDLRKLLHKNEPAIIQACPEMRDEILPSYFKKNVLVLCIENLNADGLRQTEQMVDYILENSWAKCRLDSILMHLERNLAEVPNLIGSLRRLIQILHRLLVHSWTRQYGTIWSADAGCHRWYRISKSKAIFQLIFALAVNLSPPEIQDDYFVEREIRSILERRDVWSKDAFTKAEDIEAEEPWFGEYELLFKESPKKVTPKKTYAAASMLIEVESQRSPQGHRIGHVSHVSAADVQFPVVYWYSWEPVDRSI